MDTRLRCDRGLASHNRELLHGSLLCLSGEVVNTHGPVEPDKDNIRQEPYTLPQGFTWDALDLGDRGVVSTGSSARTCWSVLVGSSVLGLLEMVLGMETCPSSQQVTLWLCHTISLGLDGSDSPHCSSLLPIPHWAAWPGFFKGM